MIENDKIMNKNIVTIIIIVVVGAGLLWYLAKNQSTPSQNQKQSQPPPTVATSSDITVTSPQAYQTITSPLNISGQAKGTWYFEASFPIVLTDWDGKIIAEHYAEAKKEWMTADFVPFEGKLKFESPVFEGVGKDHFSRRGYLIFKKDNPSGLSEYDDALEIPILFKD